MPVLQLLDFTLQYWPPMDCNRFVDSSSHGGSSEPDDSVHPVF